MSLWFRRGSREDPVVLDKRLTAIERQLQIDPIVAGGNGTGLIAPTGLSTLYVPFSVPGELVLNEETGKFRVPFDCTLSNIWVKLNTASSSGSVTARLTDGTTNWDNTMTSGNTAQSSTPAASVTAGTYLQVKVTAAGTTAADLVVIAALVP